MPLARTIGLGAIAARALLSIAGSAGSLSTPASIWLLILIPTLASGVFRARSLSLGIALASFAWTARRRYAFRLHALLHKLAHLGAALCDLLIAGWPGALGCPLALRLRDGLAHTLADLRDVLFAGPGRPFYCALSCLGSFRTLAWPCILRQCARPDQ